MIQGIERMGEVTFTEDEVKNQLRQVRKGKQSGLDCIKPELYKWLGDSEICVKQIAEFMNRVLVSGNIPTY